MSTSANLTLFQPPKSVLGTIAFLTDIGQRKWGASETVGELMDRHDLRQADVQSFLLWLHIDRHPEPATEANLHKPGLDLPKHPPEEPTDGPKVIEQILNEPEKVQFWSDFALLPLERQRLRPRGASTLAPVSVAARHPVSRQVVDATLRLIDQQTSTPGEPRPEVPSPLQEATGETMAAQPTLDVQTARTPQAVRKAQEFSASVADRQPSHPVWNEPLRTDLLPTFAPMGTQPAKREPVGPAPEDSLFGQITLIAPPMNVAVDDSSRPETTMRFAWHDLAKGAGVVDEGAFTALATSLPVGAKALYPALDPRTLTRGAVNLRLAPTMIRTLAARGYGSTRALDSEGVFRRTTDYYGGSPPLARVPAQVESRPAVLAAPRVARRLDYLGLPIHLSPTLSVERDPDQQVIAQINTQTLPRAPLTSPTVFLNLQNRLLNRVQAFDPGPQPGPTVASRILSIPPIYGRALGPGPSQRSPTVTGPVLAARTAQQPSFEPLQSRRPPAVGSPPVQRGVRASPPTSMSDMPAQVQPPTIGAPLSMVRPPTGVPARPASAGLPAFGSLGSMSASAPTATPGQPAPPSMTTPIRISPVLSRMPRPATPTSPGSRPTAQTPQPSVPGSPGIQLPRPMAPPAASLQPAAPPSTITLPPQPQPRSPVVPDQGGSSTSTARGPRMVVAPHRPVVETTEAQTLAVQTAPAAGAATAENNRAEGAAKEKKETGTQGSEVNLLANEVWSILKRRLAFEAQRSGRS